MFVCSVSTVMFNANPLLAVRRLLHPLRPHRNSEPAAKGHHDPEPQAGGPGAWGWKSRTIRFCRSGIRCSSRCIRSPRRSIVGLSCSRFCCFCNKVFEPYGLKIIGQIIGLAAIGGLVVRPLWKLGKFFWVPGRMEQVKKERLRITLAVVGAAILAFLFLPLPYRIHLHARRRSPRRQDGLRRGARLAGRSSRSSRGSRSRKENCWRGWRTWTSRSAVADLSGERDKSMPNSRASSANDTTTRRPGLEIPHVQDSLEGRHRAIRGEEARRGAARTAGPDRRLGDSPRAAVPQPPADDNERLPSWWGTPLEKRNLGAYLKAGHAVLPDRRSRRKCRRP